MAKLVMTYETGDSVDALEVEAGRPARQNRTRVMSVNPDFFLSQFLPRSLGGREAQPSFFSRGRVPHADMPDSLAVTEFFHRGHLSSILLISALNSHV